MLSAIINGIAEGAVYAILAVGLVLVFKGSRVLNLAQGEMGAFSFFTVLKIFFILGLVPEDDMGATSVGAGIALLVLTVAVAAGLGMAVERLLMRRLVERPAIQGTIVTLGLAVVLINVEAIFARLFLPAARNSFPMNAPAVVGTGQQPLENLWLIGGLFDSGAIKTSLIVLLVITGGVAAGLAYLFARTRFGLGVVAATSDNQVARILGVPVRQVYRFTWGIGGALAGVAAAFAPVVVFANTIQPGDMTLTLIRALAAAVIGGLDNIYGAIIGGLVLGITMQVSVQQFGSSVAGVENLAVLALVLLTLMVRPRGLLGGAGAEVS